MSTTHAFFSAASALMHGSSVYRKPGGTVVNVTRTSLERERKGKPIYDERYVGQVVPAEEGGCVRGPWRVQGITQGS